MFANRQFDADLASVSLEAGHTVDLARVDVDALALRGRRLQARAMNSFFAAMGQHLRRLVVG